VKALLPALGEHPRWCDEKKCRSTIANDGTVETDHTRELVATVETEHECQHVHQVWLSRLDVMPLGGEGRSLRSITLVGEDGSLGLTPRQAVALAWALLRAAVRMVVGR
jgi:hypothetical protein